MKTKICVHLLTIGAVLLACDGRADVFEDVLGYYCGGVDANGDGYVQASEIKDLRRLGKPSAASHGVTSFKSSYENANKWATCDVQLANAGTVLKNQKCIEFTTVYTKSDGTKQNNANGFLLPFTEQLKFGETNKPYTIILRFKPVEIEQEVDTDGNRYSGYGTLVVCGYDNDAKVGMRVRIHNRNETISYDCGKNAYKVPTITNETYSTRGQCWTELAIRTPQPGETSGARANLFQPGGISARGNFGGNATGVAGGNLCIGCNNSTTAENGFRGKIHMFAVWNRRLSDEELAEAFSSDPTRDGRKYGEVNDPDTVSYVPGKPIFRLGNDTYGAEMFGGGACSGAMAVDTDAFDARSFPSSFVAGGKVDFSVSLDKYQTNHANIIRFKAAATSASGVMRVLSGGAEVDRCDVKPGAFASLLVPAASLENAASTVSVECVAAGMGGLVFDSIQLGGPWSWQIGENYEDLGGGTQGDAIVIGTSAKTSWRRAINGESLKTLSYALPDDIAGSFDFMFGFKVYNFSNNSTNLWMTMNNTVIVTNRTIEATGMAIERENAYAIPLRKRVFVTGTNILSIRNYNPEGGYWNPDYWVFEPVRHRQPQGLVILLK